MNGLNSLGNLSDAASPTEASGAQEGNFDAIFSEGLVNTSAVMLQLIGGDIIQSIMKDESAVD